MKGACDSDPSTLRAIFPCGLIQPQGSYRFGLDALLLASCAVNILRAKRFTQVPRLVELGCGCGAALIGTILNYPKLVALGIDKEPQLIEAAIQNALMLELPLKFICFDFSDFKTLFKENRSWLNQTYLAMANPPWNMQGTGQNSATTLRDNALRGTKHTFHDFAKVAGAMLVEHGVFCCIISPVNLANFCMVLKQFNFGVKKIIPVCNQYGLNAKRLLIISKKNAMATPELSWPLVLYQSIGVDGKVTWTKEALEFCPWLLKAGEGR